ncbi:MAG: GntR family transcriptional regulator [Clostridiales bacterium]|nr:GntR family transcriptional regulator [Clostridiales bacterium]
MVDPQSSTPLYAQIQDDILAKVARGEFKASEKLPSEKELADRYSVSIITIRRAIAELVEQNVLKRKQGKGTFLVRKPFHRTFSRSAMSFTEICETNGVVPSARLLRGEIDENPPQEVLDKLQLPAGGKVVFIERLRYVDGFPVVIETTCFPMKYAFLLDADLDHGSLYATLRSQVPGLGIYPGIRNIRIVRADARVAGLLQVRKSTALLVVNGVCYEEGTNAPLHTTYHVGYSESSDFLLYI